MEVVDLVDRVRDHFVEQFGAFVEQQQARCKLGSAEVKLELNEPGNYFDQLYCVDFLKPTPGETEDGDDDSEADDDEADQGVVDFQPAYHLEFESTTGSYGAMAVSIEQLRWDDVLIFHDLPSLPAERIAEWFELWFDPDDERYDPDARFAEVIHALQLNDGLVSIDFGTAPAAAFWDMLELLETAGATEARITCTADEAG